ncbi:MAG: HAD family hydrolase [Caldilineaceae bacterium]|nr:HAD family hydrolase [Caldilineaceae bacterium]
MSASDSRAKRPDDEPAASLDAQPEEDAGLPARLDAIELRPGMEPLTPEEKEAFLSRARAQGRSLTSAEQYALFGPPPETSAPQPPPPEVDEMEPAALDDQAISRLVENFFPELGDTAPPAAPCLVQGIVFDFDYTLAVPTRDLAAAQAEGAQAAEAYMRSTGMEFPDGFWSNIVEARRFSEEKSEEEQEEHIADDALSFLLQFFDYPASRMDPDVLRRAVDIFYAPEMTAWQLRPGAQDLLAAFQAGGYRLALVANYNCDRVFQRMVDYLGIRRYFDMVISSAAVEYRKPDPQLIGVVLEHWDALPYEVVVVGDSLRHDIAGGLEAGALTVLLAQSTSPQVAHDNETLAGQVRPDARLDDLGALATQIKEWATP